MIERQVEPVYRLSVLTFAEVRAASRISDKTLRGIIARGELSARTVGADWRIRSEALEAYLRTPKRDGPDAAGGFAS